MSKKNEENISKKVPQFKHQREKIRKNYAPPIKTEYYYRNKLDDTITCYKGATTPVKAYRDNPNYEMLYEVAYVEVKIN